MANRVLTSAVLAKESLRILVNNLQFAGRMNRQYEKNFQNKQMRIGDTINIKKPPRYIIRNGRTLQVQDHVETTVPLKIEHQDGVDLQFTSADLALRLPEFSKKFLEPAIATIANYIDYNALSQMYSKVYNAVGTVGTTPQSSLVYLQAGGRMDEEATPRDDSRTVLLSPEAQVQTVEALKGLFNPNPAISTQYMKGEMGKALGFTFGMSQNMPTHTVGNHGGTPLINGANQVGFSLVTDGWTAGATVLNKGDVFTVAGVFAVNPQNRQSTGKLRQFVATADVVADGTGNATIPISPVLIPVGYAGTSSLLQPNNPAISGNLGFGPDADVNLAAFATVTNSPADGAVITVLGAANAVSPQNLAFHKDAFVMGVAELPMPDGVDFAGRASSSELGISIRIVRAYDINNDAFPCRLDVLYGFNSVYPELACRIVG